MSVLLLTGATGFIGGAVTAHLLEDARVKRVFALVRARDLGHARERLSASLRRFGVVKLDERLQPVAGDLESLRALPAGIPWSELTHALHCAAHTSFLSRRTAWQTNVEGTRAVAAALARAPQLERLLFVGTAYRAGVVPVRVVEEDVPASDVHVAEYTRSKAAAEAVLETCGLPVVVARPSIVIGDTRFGVGPSASLYWYYRALATAGVAPFAPGFRRDVVPADWVAATLVRLMFECRLKHRCYHVSAGERFAETWSAIRSAFGHACGEHVPAEQLTAHPAWKALSLDARTRPNFT